MREYRTELKETKEISKVICNKCGKEIQVHQGVMTEDVLHVEKRWNYPSDRDNCMDVFDLCEGCYHELIQSFQIKLED